MRSKGKFFRFVRSRDGAPQCGALCVDALSLSLNKERAKENRVQQAEIESLLVR